MDFTSQLTNVHQIKAGVEADMHYLNYRDYQVHVDASSGFVPALPTPGSFDFNTYDNAPYQLAAYIQDKIELSYLVVNIGLRFDYFEPDGAGLKNPDNIAELDVLQSPFPDSLVSKASSKSQVSPRIGISYPITDQGAVHISYGHFFQMPPFEDLYKNPNFRIPLTGNYPDFIGNVIGNANLQPQRTTMYEIGLQQELAPNLGLTVTGYYKDIRNLLGLQLFLKNNFVKFGEYVNVDYGAVQGFTISLDRRLTNGLGANLDYTYQVAKGNTSDPEDDFNKATANPPIAINQELVPLNWDRRHSLNLTITAGDSKSLLASFIVRLGSGLPVHTGPPKPADRPGKQRQHADVFQHGHVCHAVFRPVQPSTFGVLENLQRLRYRERGQCVHRYRKSRVYASINAGRAGCRTCAGRQYPAAILLAPGFLFGTAPS